MSRRQGPAGTTLGPKRGTKGQLVLQHQEYRFIAPFGMPLAKLCVCRNPRGSSMRSITCFMFLLGASMACGILAEQPLLAALGGSADSIESDRRMLSAVQGKVTQGADYTDYEITYGWTNVREYVSPQGIVFAIAWTGNRSPDLTTLLGSYANEYQQALKATPHHPGVRQRAIKTDDVVVERWGQVRNLHGRAYAPSLIPPGVSTDEIR